MTIEIAVLTLKELVTASLDGDWGAETPGSDLLPYRVIRGADFPAARIRNTSEVPTRYLSKSSAARRTLKPNDIVIETAGGSKDRSTGRTLFVTDRLLESLGEPVTCASFARFLRIDPAKADPQYVYWYLQQLHQSGGMWEHQVQHTGVARFQYTIFANTHKIALPSIQAQKRVAAVLRALDEKIAVNDRIIRGADELRTTRLRHWQRSSSEAVEGRPLSSFASFVNGRAFTKDATGTGRMVIRIAEVNSGPGPSTVYNDIEVPDVHLARPGDVLFAWSGSLTVARWYRPEAIINQHIFKVIPNGGAPKWMAYELVLTKLADFKGIAADKATTMGHIQRHHLDEPVLVPRREHMAALDAELGPLWDYALAAEQESLTLAELRDTLLPKLMSGEIRVRDAERVVEDAT